MVVLQRIIESPQKFSARLGIVLPRIFTIEDDRHNGVPSSRSKYLSRVLNVLDQVCRGFLRRHSRVHKSNEVRDRMVPKDKVHARLRVLVTMNRVQLLSRNIRQAAMSVAHE